VPRSIPTAGAIFAMVCWDNEGNCVQKGIGIRNRSDTDDCDTREWRSENGRCCGRIVGLLKDSDQEGGGAESSWILSCARESRNFFLRASVGFQLPHHARVPGATSIDPATSGNLWHSLEGTRHLWNFRSLWFGHPASRCLPFLCKLDSGISHMSIVGFLFCKATPDSRALQILESGIAYYRCFIECLPNFEAYLFVASYGQHHSIT